MKYLMILSVGLCLLFASLPAMTDQAEDEAAIRAWIEQRADAYNRHDAKALGAQLDENFENWTGSQKGRAAYEKSTAENFERDKDLQVKLLEVIGIVFVTPDVAILKYRNEFTGGTDEDGKPLPPSRTLSANVLVKKGGKWLRLALFSRAEE